MCESFKCTTPEQLPAQSELRTTLLKEIQLYLIWFFSILFSLFQFDLIQLFLIQFSSIQFHPIQLNSICFSDIYSHNKTLLSKSKTRGLDTEYKDFIATRI